MNMISTGAFLPEVDASNKQETTAEKFARVWEKKNSKVARAGGVSLMALSLAACGSSSTTTTTTPVTPTPEPEAPAPTVNNYALETTADYIAGKVGENDVVTATGLTYNAGDAIVDVDATDADSLTVTATGDIAATATVAGIETVNFNLDGFTATGVTTDAIFEAKADNITATTFNVDNVKVGSSIASASVTGLATGSTVNFSSDFTTALVDGDDNAALTMTTAATSATAQSTAGALTAATVTSTAATAATIASDSDGTLTATTTAADMVIQAASATTVEATSAGSIDANTTDLTAATSVTLTATDEVNVGLAAAATATISAGGTTDSTIEDGVGNTLTSVSLSGNGSAHTFNLNGAEGIASVTITGSQAVNIDMDASDIDGLTSNALTVVDNSTATSTLEITGTAGDMDLSAAAVDVISVGINNTAKTITVASGATVTMTVDQGASAIDGSDAGAASNTVTVKLDDGVKTSDAAADVATSLTFTDFASATIDVSTDGVTSGTYTASSITNIVGSADNTSVTINAGSNGVTLAGTHNIGTGALVINSDGAVALGASDITAASVTTTGTGAVTWTDANSTEVVAVTTGGGADAITWADTSASITVSTGAGVDTVTVNDDTVAAKTYSIDLGTGATDKLVLAKNGGDYSAGTLTLAGVEIIEFADDALTATLAAATLDGKGYIIDHADVSDTINVTVALGTANAVNLGNLVIDGAGLTTADTLTVDGNAKTVAVTLTGADGIGSDLTGGSKADTLTSGTGDDVLVGNAGDDIMSAGAGDDQITGDAGADTMTGGAGNDTYVFDTNDVAAGESIVEAASGGTDVVSVNTTTDFTNMSAASFDEIETIQMASGQTGTFTGDQLTGETITIKGAGGTEGLVVNVAFGGTVDLSGLTGNTWTAGTDTVTINGLGGAETITGTGMNDTINLGAGADTVKVAFGGAGVDTISGFTAGAGGDVFDFTGTTDVVNTGGNVDLDGFLLLATTGGLADHAIVDGITVLDNGAAGVDDLGSMDAAGLVAELTDLADAGANNAVVFDDDGDVFYIVASDGTDTGIFKVEDNTAGSTTIAAADVTLIAILSGIADAGTLTADNFADFA